MRLLFPEIVNLPEIINKHKMKSKHTTFIRIYSVWASINLIVLILALLNVFGTSNHSFGEFWPFTVGSLRYYDFYELAVYLGMPLLIYFVYCKSRSKRFWITYIIWATVNFALMMMAVLNVFGPSDRSANEFWPFSVGALLYYDILELVVYLCIPLIVYYLYCIVKDANLNVEE